VQPQFVDSFPGQPCAFAGMTIEREDTMTGDSTGDYRGPAYRNEAALKAWLGKRPSEAALEPDLPIIDPHHHFWEPRSAAATCCRSCWPTLAGAQHCLHGLPRMPLDVPQGWPRRDGADRRGRIVNGIAAMSASGGYGPCRVAEAIIGHADLTLGARVREVLEAEIRVGGGRFRGIRHGVSWDSNDAIQKFATRVVPPHQLRDPKFARASPSSARSA